MKDKLGSAQAGVPPVFRSGHNYCNASIPVVSAGLRRSPRVELASDRSVEMLANCTSKAQWQKQLDKRDSDRLWLRMRARGRPESQAGRDPRNLQHQEGALLVVFQRLPGSSKPPPLLASAAKWLVKGLRLAVHVSLVPVQISGVSMQASLDMSEADPS